MNHKQLHRKVKDYQNLFHLRDWTIHLNTGMVPCNEMKLWLAEGEDLPAHKYSGMAYSLPDRQEAYVWVPVQSLIESGDESVEEVLCHEMLHVMFAAYPDNEELKVRILSPLVYDLTKP